MQLEGKIIEYSPNAMRDHNDDGTWDIYTLIGIAVSNPGYAGPNPLKVYHDGTDTVPACWQQVGSQVRLELAPEDLKMSQLFWGAIVDPGCVQ